MGDEEKSNSFCHVRERKPRSSQSSRRNRKQKVENGFVQDVDRYRLRRLCHGRPHQKEKEEKPVARGGGGDDDGDDGSNFDANLLRRGEDDEEEKEEAEFGRGGG